MLWIQTIWKILFLLLSLLIAVAFPLTGSAKTTVKRRTVTITKGGTYTFTIREAKRARWKIKKVQIQYSTNKAFKKGVKNKKVGKSKNKVTLKLKRKKTYFIRVRYVGKDGFSRWSKVKKVKTR